MGDEDSTESSVVQEMLREDIIKVMASLSPRERHVLRLRFGLDDGRSRNSDEIGQLFGVTSERIRQIEAKALRKLRKDYDCVVFEEGTSAFRPIPKAELSKVFE